MKKFLLAAVYLLFGTLISIQAYAGPMVFNDTNGTIDVYSLDWNVGNALAVNSVPVSASPSTNSFDIFMQATLGGFNDIEGDSIIGTGLNAAYEITVVAGFREIGYTIANSATFVHDPTGTINFVELYLDTNISGVGNTKSNSLTGNGYHEGSLLLSGHIISSNGGFTIVPNPDGSIPTGNLDNFVSNNYPGIGTVVGTGSNNFAAAIDYVDSTYILNALNLDNLLVSMISNTSQILPYDQTNPSGKFWNGTADILPNLTPTPGNPLYTKVNGFAPTDGNIYDFQFQADANSSFTTIPEPTTMLLLGIGLLGFAGVARKKQE